MKNLLIVSPTFLPKTSADMQRVRMMIQHLNKHGWQPTILTANPNELSGPDDPILASSLDTACRIVYFNPIPIWLTRFFGVRNLGWRSLWSLKKTGLAILKNETFDCVLFSTTMFVTWRAGKYWKKRTGVSYILDFQDPWWRFSPRSHAAPGHPFKAWIASLSARYLEPGVIRNASGIITVSPAYKTELLKRYNFLNPDQVIHIPFSGSPDDFELLRTITIPNRFFNPSDGKQHYVYVGRLGDDMVPALNALFRSFKEYLKCFPETAQHFRFHFIGTSYATGKEARLVAIPLAVNWELLDYVIETPERVPYLDALKAISDSAGIIILGSTDSSYSPSKLFPALLSEKPILCIAAKDSLLSDFVVRYSVPATLWDYTYAQSNETLIQRFHDQSGSPVSELPEALLELTLAEKMTGRVCEFINKSIST